MQKNTMITLVDRIILQKTILFLFVILLSSCNSESSNNKISYIESPKKLTLKEKLDNWQIVKDSIKEAIANTPIKPKNSVKKVSKIHEQEIAPNINYDFEEIKGYYVGTFEALTYKRNKSPSYINKINISLDSLDFEKRILFGHSIVAGNSQKFKGTIILYETGNFSADVNELGTNKYNGSFQLSFDKKKKNLYGKWAANDDNLAVTQRELDLYKSNFKYQAKLNFNIKYDIPLYTSNKDPHYYEGSEFETVTKEVNKLNASTQKLTSKDLENLYKGDLEIIRNAIYARHGYSFKNRKMRYFFDRMVDWYIPVSTDVRNQLTKLELENIELIKRYEEHAEKYYDYFGR